MSNVNSNKLQIIAEKWNVPLNLLESLIRSSSGFNINERKVGDKAELEDIITKFLNSKNDN